MRTQAYGFTTFFRGRDAPWNWFDFLVVSFSPKRVVGCREGVGMLSCLVSWFVLVCWFLGVLVCWFLGFLVSWFLSFKVSWFLVSKVSKIYQIWISCFLEDIDPIAKTFKDLLDGSSGFSVPSFSHILKWVDFPIFEIIRS